MGYWLLKSEPGDYSFSDLVSDQIAEWDGVTANPAQSDFRRCAKAPCSPIVRSSACHVYQLYP